MVDKLSVSLSISYPLSIQLTDVDRTARVSVIPGALIRLISGDFVAGPRPRTDVNGSGSMADQSPGSPNEALTRARAYNRRAVAASTHLQAMDKIGTEDHRLED